MTKTLLLSAAFCCGMLAQAQQFTEVPFELETTTWDATAQSLGSDNVTVTDLDYTVEVGVLDDEVYIQGLCPRFPEAWVVGVIEGIDLIIAPGQKLGTFKSSSGGTYPIYFSGYDGSSTAVVEAAWQYDGDAHEIYGDAFVTTADLSSILALDVISNIVLKGPEDLGVTSVTTKDQKTATYNLAGQRIMNGWWNGGIRIENGKKVIK